MKNNRYMKFETINRSDMETGKIVVNGVEITDVESWNKAIQTFSELEYQIKKKDKKIERLQNIINELEKGVSEAIKQLELLKYIDKYRFTYDKEFQKAIDKLKELKGE